MGDLVGGCIARANVIRSVLCLLFPFAAAALYINRYRSLGYDMADAGAVLFRGDLNTLSLVFVVSGIIAWVVVVWPKVILALKFRTCAISVDGDVINFYSDCVPIKDVQSVSIETGIFRTDLSFGLKGRPILCRSIVLLSPKPEQILSRLRTSIRQEFRRY